MATASTLLDGDVTKILHPVESFPYQTRWGAQRTLTVRALSIREMLDVSAGLANFWELSIGQPQQWLKRLHPLELERLSAIVEKLNAAPEDEVEPSDPKKPVVPLETKLRTVFYVLVKNGHDPRRLLDYTVQQLFFWHKVATVESSAKADDLSRWMEAARCAVWGSAEQFEKFQKVMREFAEQNLAGKEAPCQVAPAN